MIDEIDIFESLSYLNFLMKRLNSHLLQQKSKGKEYGIYNLKILDFELTHRIMILNFEFKLKF